MGLRAAVIPEKACCGLTWITTGQLDTARRIVGQAVQNLHGYVTSGTPVIALEPSCLAAIREDAGQLVDDPRVAEVSAGIASLAEFLAARVAAGEWTVPDLTGVEVVAQPHCHHHAVIGWQTDAALLAQTGATVRRVGGCCGLAGNFGVEIGHYETSVAIAEHDLLPAVRAAGPDAVVLADGFSCRTQLDDLAGRRALHLAELLQLGRSRSVSDEPARPRTSGGRPTIAATVPNAIPLKVSEPLEKVKSAIPTTSAVAAVNWLVGREKSTWLSIQILTPITPISP